MENKISISLELANALFNYLGNQRFVEVAGLIQKFQEEANGQLAAPAAEAPETPAS
jgi:hypothetical protein